jgi:hypothetical protein
MRVMGRQVVSSRYRLVREVRFLCRSGVITRVHEDGAGGTGLGRDGGLRDLNPRRPSPRCFARGRQPAQRCAG